MKNIYLCGFMGCGKTFIGKMISDALDMTLIDLDDYIVEQEKMSIPEIFEKKGEPYFRQAEADYIRRLENCVVATGGGAMLRDETAEFARSKGVRVFIDTDFEVCYNRIKNDANRPLVQKNTAEQLFDIYTSRKPIYIKNTDFNVDGNQPAHVIAENIIQRVKKYVNL